MKSFEGHFSCTDFTGLGQHGGVVVRAVSSQQQGPEAFLCGDGIFSPWACN